VDPEDFLPASPRDRGEMLKELRELAGKIGDAPLRELVLGCLKDDNFREKFVRSPAAKSIHHAYLGGLLEHTLTVMQMADRVADVYPGLNRDLLLAGAFFHDIGKTRELGQERSFEYSDEGRLMGHIVMGTNMFTDWAESHPGLSDETVLKLCHMILSHHGSYEFGSPKRPKFAEALVLNYIDEMDSKVQTLKEIAGREAGQKWSSFQKLFDRYLYLGKPHEKAKKPSNRKKTEFTHRPFDQLSEQESPEEAERFASEEQDQSLDLFPPSKSPSKKR
jgi:3'-5' exoribonuclease